MKAPKPPQHPNPHKPPHVTQAAALTRETEESDRVSQECGMIDPEVA